jgi:hypothetical protein
MILQFYYILNPEDVVIDRLFLFAILSIFYIDKTGSTEKNLLAPNRKVVADRAGANFCNLFKVHYNTCQGYVRFAN